MDHIYEKEFDFVISRAKSLDRPARMVVAGADCENIVKAVFEAEAQGFARPILVGNEDRIIAVLKKLGLYERNYVISHVPDYEIKEGDVLIATSNSGRNAVPVLLAHAAQKRGAYVIALTNMNHTTAVTSRNRLGLRLFETANLILDNGGVLGDASVEFADGAMVGPTSTAAGAAILQAIVCRVKELSLEENFEADFYKSSNVDGGDEWNDRLIERYKDVIPGLL